MDSSIKNERKSENKRYIEMNMNNNKTSKQLSISSKEIGQGSQSLKSFRWTRLILLFFTFHFLSFSFFRPLSSFAQSIGSWQIYPAYTVCTYNIPVGNRIYALMESNLMAYDIDDQSITTFDWMRQLNDVTIEFIRYSEQAHRLIIIYDNGNIDLLSTENDDDVINLAQLKNSSMQNKKVNNVHIVGSLAYVCTGFGIVVIDMNEAIISKTYNLETSITACTATDTHIFAASSSGLWQGSLNDNLQDKNNWKKLNNSFSATFMEFFDGCLWAQVGNNVMISNPEVTSFSKLIQLNKATFWTNSANQLIVGNAQTTCIFNNKNDYQTITGHFTWNQLTVQGNTFWASDGYQGLQGYTLDGNTFQLTTQKIHPNSPLHNYTYHLRYSGDRLMIAGGNRHYTASSRPGTAMILESDGTWVNFDPQSVATLLPNEIYQDVTNIVNDPKDASHFYVGTTRSGIFEFKDDQCIGHDGLENSPMQSILPDVATPQYFVVGDGLQYDRDGNLWVLNCTQGRQDTTIRVMRPDGTWTGIPCPEVQAASTLDNIYFDSRGWAWITSRRMDARGIFMLDYKNTIDNSADDHRQLRGTLINQDGTSYTPDGFFCAAEDVDGSVWVGTNLGPFLIKDPTTFRNTNFNFEQVKVSRNDGSGLADYLLNGIPITAIAIDGGGRKWFGTQENGIFFISADCQEEIYHFTTENSPIPSDDIFDIVIHPSNGQVMFATDKGLCSFVSDATAPEEELDKDSIEIFPNPVEPDYNGPIIVRGLVEDCEVKITSSTGQLIFRGTSNGGTFTWNGCNTHGKRVASGIYSLIANTPDGKKAVIRKIAFIR